MNRQKDFQCLSELVEVDWMVGSEGSKENAGFFLGTHRKTPQLSVQMVKVLILASELKRRRSLIHPWIRRSSDVQASRNGTPY